MMRCERHLKAAHKALAVVRQAKAECVLSDAGWQYIAKLAAQLRQQLAQSSFMQLAAKVAEIGHRACLIVIDREDPTSEADFESRLESPQDAPPRIMRDPFPFPPFKSRPGEETESPKERSMDPQAREYFLGLLLLAKHSPARMPSPDNPPDEASERAADEYVRWLTRATELELPSPEAACALIPRLEMVEAFGSYVEPLFQRHALRLGIAADSSLMIEWYLITYWYEYWRDRWLAGVLADE
jgi:hypothetical protein